MFKHLPRCLAPLSLLFAGTAIAVQPATFGTPERPFAADSPWNARPVEPVFGQYEIPTSRFAPAIGAGAFSTGVFVSNDNDPTVQVFGPPGKAGVADADTGAARIITIPHWPSSVVAAKGSDGHADIIDPATGIIHSFWQLKYDNGRWSATLYAWSRLDGRGWGDPAHFYQGARATGVPTSAGIIRRHEVDDGTPLYRHALAMSLTFNALSREPAYIYPATAADRDAAGTNSGQIPEGALMMLPPSYDTSRIANPQLRKVAETLKVYGAYVVDRNEGTPFYIYAENGSGFRLHANGWDNAVGNELQRIRAALRQVVSAKGWVDGNEQPFTPTTRINLLSMQGTWRGAGDGRYDPRSGALNFGGGNARMVSLGLFNLSRINWAAPKPGQQCKLTVHASGGAKLKLLVRSMDYANVLFDSGELGDQASKQFDCPSGGVRTELQALSGGNGASSVRADLRVDGAGAP